MRLFNAGSMFNDRAQEEILPVIDQPKELSRHLIEIKKKLLKAYRFTHYRMPKDFTTTSYIIATNHLTDSDAPLMISLYYEIMHKVMDGYPQLFVFAKENCFNGVSIPQDLLPILEMEMVIPVDRNRIGGAMTAMKAAKKWYQSGKKPKHFLIFSQGTIYDINQERAEDIEPGAFWLSRMLGIPVLPAFIEQAVEGEENRLVFGEAILVEKNSRDLDRYKQLWIDRVIEAQNALEPLTGFPARKAVLDAEHQSRKRFKSASQ